MPLHSSQNPLPPVMGEEQCLNTVARRIRLLAILNLVQFSYIHSVVLLSVLFLKKVPKTGQSCTAFGVSFVQELLCNIFQSVRTSPLAACRNAWGGKNSLRSNIMPPVSKHCSATRCASQRCPSALGGEYALTHNKFLLTKKIPLLIGDIAVLVFTKGIKKRMTGSHSLFTIIGF